MPAPSWFVDAGVLALTHVGRGALTVRLLVALGLTYAIGFEREVRGSTAGNRTFALVGVGAAVVAFLATNGAPNALAGVITGIGFLGAGVIIHEGGSGTDTVRGVTTAATIFAAAAVGAAAGQGALLLAAEAAVATLAVLEIRHSPVLRVIDGRYWAGSFHDDPPMHMTDAERRGHPPEPPTRPEVDGTD